MKLPDDKLTREELQEIAADAADFYICRHKWRLAGTVSIPADEENGYPKEIRTVRECHALCRHITWSKPRKRL
jgi:hypothetical protein